MPNYTRTPDGRLIDTEAASDARTYATFMHLTVFLAHALILVLPALAMWLIKRKDSAFIDDHGKEAVNFQISLLIYSIVSGALTLVLIGFPMLIAVYVLAIVASIRAAMAANRGEFYRYPMTIRLVA